MAVSQIAAALTPGMVAGAAFTPATVSAENAVVVCNIGKDVPKEVRTTVSMLALGASAIAQVPMLLFGKILLANPWVLGLTSAYLIGSAHKMAVEGFKHLLDDPKNNNNYKRLSRNIL